MKRKLKRPLGIELLLGDNMKYLKLFVKQKRKFELIVIDPPYDMKKQKDKKHTSTLHKSMNDLRAELIAHDLVSGLHPDRLRTLTKLQDKLNIYIWCNKKQIPMYLKYYVEKLNCSFEIIKWVKTNPVPSYHNKYMSDTEYCLYFRRGAYCNPKNFQEASTLYTAPINQKDKKKYNHPTPKPLPILRRVIGNSAKKGDRVLDCYIGSGSTGVVCKELGFNFTGIELVKKHYITSKNRISETETNEALINNTKKPMINLLAKVRKVRYEI